MHPVDVRIHHWYVPMRLIWDEFEDFITGGPDGLDASPRPYINIGAGNPGATAVGSLGDYLGLPNVTGAGYGISALPFRAYNMIWNEYYRDQDLQAELVNSSAGGVDLTSNITLMLS